MNNRGVLLSALGFPLLVILGGVIGFVFPSAAHSIAWSTNYLLGIIMFGMGLSLVPQDFVLVVTRPLPVLIGVVAQFVIMPAVAIGVVKLLRLPDEIAAGVILVGCAPGGTSSNVVTYMARGDLALSVTMTSISTLLAPLLTPVLTLWLAGQYMPLNAGTMALSIVQVVLVPVVAGIVIHVLARRFVEKVLPALPWISVIAISTIVAIVVSGTRKAIFTAGLAVFIAVVLHNCLGYLLGYAAGIVTKQPVEVRRTMSVEVGMQNSGLAAGLAAQYFSPLSALPAALFSVWHNLSGAVVATICRWSDTRRGRNAPALQ